jgi:CDP-6-deoxy-D-xylo-4-hexulose-3-dehydrase
MTWKKWATGDPLTINRVVWDEAELNNIADVFKRDWFGPSKWAVELEAWMRIKTNTQFSQLTNSGSSALLLAVQSLVDKGIWKAGDRIIHPACTFPTSCTPLVLFGLVPVFIDVEPGTYNLNAKTAARALRDKAIKGAVIPHLLGNMTDIDVLKDALGERALIEDCCDTLGSLWRNVHVGGFGIAAAFSFYASHHITTGGVGGCLVTNSKDLYDHVRSLTFWGRKIAPGRDAYQDFLDRYTYQTIGHDMQMTEIQAAFGYAQTHRYPAILEGRRKRFEQMQNFFTGKYERWFVTPKSHPKASPSWFGYPLEVRQAAPFERNQLAKALLDAKIEIRPLFAGNIIRQDAYKNVPHEVFGTLAQADSNMVNALFLPSWLFMTDEQMDYQLDVLGKFLARW